MEHARHPLYQAALDADDAFQIELIRVFGKAKAQDARYQTRMFTDYQLRSALHAKLDADEAWRKALIGEHS